MRSLIEDSFSSSSGRKGWRLVKTLFYQGRAVFWIIYFCWQQGGRCFTQASYLKRDYWKPMMNVHCAQFFTMGLPIKFIHRFFLASTWLSMGADPKLPLLALAEKIGTRGCLTGFTWTLRMLELLWLFGGFLKWWYPTTIPWDSVYPNMIFIWMIPGIRVHQQMALISMVVCWPFILVYLMMPNYAYIWCWFVQCGKVDAWWCRPFTFHKENDEPIYGA